MLWGLVVLLLVLWVLGLTTAAVGSVIHLLLVLAAVVVVYNLVVGRRGAIG